MSDTASMFPTSAVASKDDAIIKLAVLAVGGQGGGVLTDWITDLAERNGYLAQSTSVAGWLSALVRRSTMSRCAGTPAGARSLRCRLPKAMSTS